MANLGLVQGLIGQPFGSAVEGPAFGLLNEILGTYRSRDGIARPARYEVVILPPAGMQGRTALSNSEGARNVSLKCENISIPGRNIDTTPDTNIYGPTREIASGFSFAEITARFQCSSDLKERIFFEEWQKSSFNQETWSMNFYNEYTGQIDIFLLDEQNNRRYGVKMWDCFAKNVGAQQLDYSTINEQMKIDVTFSYRYWTNLNTEGDYPKPLNDRLIERFRDTTVRRIESAIPRALSL